MVREGHDVTLFATGDAITKAKLISLFPQALGIGAPDLNAKSFVHFAHAFEKQGEFDIIHNHGGFFGLIFSPFLKTPMVTTMHNVYLTPGTVAFDVLKDKSYFISISQAQRKAAIGLNVLENVYNCIDIDKYRLETKKENYLLWLSNLVPDKGPDTAIKVAKELGIKLIMAGKIDYNIPKNVKYYEEVVKPHVDNKNIVFYEELTPEEKNELYAKAKCFLFPIRWEEPFGMVMPESMACGTPVVAYKGGAVPEVMKDGETGYVLEKEDYAGFIKSVKKVLDGKIDPLVCRKRVEENFTPEIMAKNYLTAYEKALKKKG